MKASILRVVVYILLQTQLSVTWMSNSLLSMVGNSYDDQGRSLIPDSLLASHNNALLISIIYYLFILFIIIIYAWWTISVSEEWILVWLWGRSWDRPLDTGLSTAECYTTLGPCRGMWLYYTHTSDIRIVYVYTCHMTEMELLSSSRWLESSVEIQMFFTIFILNVQSWLDNKSQRFVKQ